LQIIFNIVKIERMTMHNNLLPEIIAIAKQAADKIKAIYQDSKDYEVKFKSDLSPITLADRTAHEFIYNSLKLLTPDIPIISEEGKIYPYQERKDWTSNWLVDPLDGTKEFIEQTGEFTVNIALIKNNTSVLGVVSVPMKNQIYWAEAGSSAFCQENNEKPTKINVFPNLDLTRVTISRRHGSQDKLDNLLHKLGPYKLISCGSTLKICLIAHGKADLYPRYGNTSEWDTAAGQCILEAAGGHILDLSGQPMQYNNKETMVNPEFVAMANKENFQSWFGNNCG
jgi:3'(2'), 5'-bisphosphate nucleotidase